MNRQPANAYDSGDSASDWDTTVAESPDRAVPPAFNINHDNAEGDYATVIPRARTSLKDGNPVNSDQPPKPMPITTPRKGKMKDDEDHYSIPSPPPHMSSFKNALSDYSDINDQNPEIPPRMHEGKGQPYKITSPSPTIPPAVTVNWDDSDEEILRELRQNIEKEKLKQEAKQEALMKEKFGPSFLGHTATENQGFMPSPRSQRSQKSVLDRRFIDRKDTVATARPKLVDPQSVHGSIVEPNSISFQSEARKKKKVKKKEEMTEPVMVKDLNGNRCIYYFEEGSHHLLEVLEDDTEAFLPDKIEEVERLFKRVWREVFSILRIITSFFVLFVTEFMSYAIHHVFQPLVLGSLSAVGNHLLMPMTTITFNLFVQPVFALIWNLSNAFVLAINPLMQLLSNIVKQVALLLQSLRLFHFTYNQASTQHSLETV